MKFFDRVAVNTDTTGTGNITPSSSVNDSWLSFSEGGVVNGDTFRYVIHEGDDFELGEGVYNGTSFTRTVNKSKIGGTVGTTKMDLGGAATVSLVATADDLRPPQNVVATTSTQVHINSTTWTDSGITATITPTNAEHKVLINISAAYMVIRNSGQFAAAGIRLLRDSTTIWEPSVADAYGPYGLQTLMAGSNNVNMAAHAPVLYVDSPATTTATTYKLQGRSYATGSVLLFQPNDSGTNGKSFILLQELKA